MVRCKMYEQQHKQTVDRSRGVPEATGREFLAITTQSIKRLHAPHTRITCTYAIEMGFLHLVRPSPRALSLSLASDGDVAGWFHQSLCIKMPVKTFIMFSQITSNMRCVMIVCMVVKKSVKKRHGTKIGLTY